MAKIKIKSAKEIELIRDAGALAAETLIRAGEMCKPGVSTLEIDEFIGDYTRKHKGISACMGYHGYPRYACISINEVVCHGIPSANTILKDGDIVNIDITTILSGYHGDTSAMFCVGRVSNLAQELVDTAKFCMEEGIRAAGEDGARYYDIGNAIHHEEPTLYHFRNNVLKQFIEVGNVFTVEPMINVGRPGTKTLADGWTAVTRDGSLSAQWEHTIARTKNGIEILTLPR